MDNELRELLSAILVMQQRNYDLLAGLLNDVDPSLNSTIFDAHAQGRLFNPDLMVPDYGRDEDGTPDPS